METIASILLVLAFCAFVAFIWISLKQAQPKAGTRRYDVPGVRLDVTDDAKVAVRQRGGSTVIDINYASPSDASAAGAPADSFEASLESIVRNSVPSRDVYAGQDAPSAEDREYWRRLNAIVGLTDADARERLIKLLEDAGFLDDDDAADGGAPAADGAASAGDGYVDDYDYGEQYYENEGAGGASGLDDVDPPAAAAEPGDDFSETVIDN